MSRARHRHRAPGLLGRCGVTAIEFAFTFPIVLMIIFGLIDFGRWFWVQTSLDYAVQAAARCAAIDPSNCIAPGEATANVPAYAASQMYGVSIDSSAFTYDPAKTVCDAPVGLPGRQVSATYGLSLVFVGGTPSVTLTATACYPT